MAAFSLRLDLAIEVNRHFLENEYGDLLFFLLFWAIKPTAWELVTLWVRNIPVTGEEYKWNTQSMTISISMATSRPKEPIKTLGFISRLPQLPWSYTLLQTLSFICLGSLQFITGDYQIFRSTLSVTDKKDIDHRQYYLELYKRYISNLGYS